MLTNQTLTVAQAAQSQTQPVPQEPQNRLDELQTCNGEQIQKLQEELEKAWADRDVAVRELLSSPSAFQWAFYYILSSLCAGMLIFPSFFKCFSGELEDFVSSHKTALLQKEQEAIELEDKGRQLQTEVRTPKDHLVHLHAHLNQAMLKIFLCNLILVPIYMERGKGEHALPY